MKIVYIDQFGCFAALVMAASCLGLLSARANYRDVLNLPYFADQHNYQPGKLYYVGQDQTGTEYYTLGVGSYGDFIKSIVWPDILKLTELKEKILIYDVSSNNSLFLYSLEVISRGKLRSVTKYLWAYWFAKQ